MQHLISLPGSVNAFGRAALLAAVVLLAGCATWTFTPLRESHFVNVDAERLHVEYGREKRTETLANGIVCTYEGKVRLTLPDGKRIVLYQTLTTSGIRYHSGDKRYEFIEKAPYCLLRRQGQVIFEGIFRRQ